MAKILKIGIVAEGVETPRQLQCLQAMACSQVQGYLISPPVPAMEDKRLLGNIRYSWLESGSVYGYRKVTDDLRDLGETCSKRRVYRLMRHEKLRSQTGYHRCPGKRGGSISEQSC